jgi:hypothetical protein
MEELFVLTKEQQKAWNNFKKAMKSLQNKGLFFYDNYGMLGVCDANKIVAYNDIDEVGFCDSVDIHNPNEIKSLFGDSWCDDTHWFHPNKDYLKKLI